MKQILLFMIGLLCTLQVGAQETDAMLFGDVKSKTTGKHLPYATIKVKGTKLKTVCDGTGHFKLVHLPLGKQTIIASIVGYKDQELEVQMQSEKVTSVYFQLEDDELSVNQVVVTGTRTQHYVKSVPIRTEVLTSKAITNKNAQNVFEALENTPGIRVEQQCQF